jgi:hypothetical protein
MQIEGLLDHICYYTDSIPSDVCDRVITFFNHLEDEGITTKAVSSGKNGETILSDEVVAVDDYLNTDRWASLKEELCNNYILPTLTKHVLKYKGVDLEGSKIIPDSAIISRYPKGEGQFKAHQDAMPKGNDDYLRSLTIVAYLNDVQEGGETYFFNQDVYAKPRKGTVCIFPSGFTHSHEGRRPISDDKYIIVLFSEIMVFKSDEDNRYIMQKENDNADL